MTATPWCQREEDGTLTEHVWINDQDGPVCTNCGDTLADWKAITRHPPAPDDEEQGFWIYRDGRLIAGPFDSHLDAVGDLHRRQPQSVAWATKYEGWEIRETARP